ncbi:hypothetical protein A0R60_1008 [Enterobacter asburiae]|nr:hypothetical protein A0R60_1008 [Enterobacter asburiae]
MDVSGYFRKMTIWAIKQRLISEPASALSVRSRYPEET